MPEANPQTVGVSGGLDPLTTAHQWHLTPTLGSTNQQQTPGPYKFSKEGRHTPMELFETLTHELATITDSELMRSDSKSEPREAAERLLGTIHNPDTRRMHALAFRYRMLESEARHNGRYMTDTEEQEMAARELKHKYRMLHMVASVLFWTAAKNEIAATDGHTHIWRVQGLCVRRGWEVVRCDHRHPNPAAIMLGIGPQLPTE